MKVLQVILKFLPLIYEILKNTVFKKGNDVLYIVTDNNEKIILITVDAYKARVTAEKHNANVQTYILEK